MPVGLRPAIGASALLGAGRACRGISDSREFCPHLCLLLPRLPRQSGLPNACQTPQVVQLKEPFGRVLQALESRSCCRFAYGEAIQRLHLHPWTFSFHVPVS